MTKLLIGLLGAGVIATAGYAAATSVDDRSGAHGVAAGCNDAATTRRPRTTADHHRNDDRGASRTSRARATRRSTGTIRAAQAGARRHLPLLRA